MNNLYSLIRKHLLSKNCSFESLSYENLVIFPITLFCQKISGNQIESFPHECFHDDFAAEASAACRPDCKRLSMEA